jgi:hypothetical protein
MRDQIRFVVTIFVGSIIIGIGLAFCFPNLPTGSFSPTVPMEYTESVMNRAYDLLNTNPEESISTFQRIIDRPGFGTIQKGEAGFALSILCEDEDYYCWAEEQLRGPMLSESQIWRVYDQVKERVLVSSSGQRLRERISWHGRNNASVKLRDKRPTNIIPKSGKNSSKE